MYSFIMCLCENDYSYLYKNIPKKRITQHEKDYFENLRLEYFDLIDNNGNFNDIINESILVANIRILESALILLTELPDSVKNSLKSIGIKLTGKLHKDMLILSAKRDNLIRKYNELPKKEENKITKKQFLKIISILSTYFKLHLNVYEITVYDYCGYYNQYLEEIEQIKPWQRKA